MARYSLAVLTRAVEGRDEEFNRWYTDQHLDDVLKVPGVSAAQRFKIRGPSIGPGETWQYFALYEMDTEDPEATLAEIAARANTDQMPISDAMQEIVYGAVYEPITELRHAK